MTCRSCSTSATRSWSSPPAAASAKAPRMRSRRTPASSMHTSARTLRSRSRWPVGWAPREVGGGMLTLRGVVAGYGYGDVLRGVDLTVARGSVTCVVGPNGAGKSTVLRAVSGLLRPRQGAITFEGEDIGSLSPAQILGRGVSQVPQSNGVFPNLSVRENVLLGAYIIRRDRGLVARRLAAAAELFPIVAE